MNSYFIKFDYGGFTHTKFETDYAVIKHYKQFGYGGLKILKEVSIGKFEVIYEQKRKKIK